MGHRTTSGERGATLVALLMLLAVVGVAASIAAQAWTTRLRKEKEEELLFRGRAYQEALRSYARVTPPGANPRPIRLEDLVVDDRFPHRVRHLRRVYLDPVGDAPFVVLRDAEGRVRGVASASRRSPLKRTSFPDDVEHFELAASYADWTFVADGR